MAFKRSGVRPSSPLLPFRMVRARSTQRRLNGGTVSPARKLENPRVSVGCPYTDPIHGHRVRQRPPGSLRFLTHAMGRDGVGNAWNVNRTLEVGGSTPLGSTSDSARWRATSSAATVEVAGGCARRIVEAVHRRLVPARTRWPWPPWRGCCGGPSGPSRRRGSRPGQTLMLRAHGLISSSCPPAVCPADGLSSRGLRQLFGFLTD
jgi:hypothetical protein